LYLPIKYNYEYQKPIINDYQQLIDMANSYNPEIQLQQHSIDIADVNLKFNKNQAQPDMDFNIALKASQNNGVFGFESYSDSLSNIKSPDTLLQQYQLSYHYPIANRQVKANVKQAASVLRSGQLNLQQQQRSIAYAIENASITLQSSRLRTTIAKRQRNLARKTLSKALKQQQIREITEYEMVDKNQVLLDAERKLIDAQKDYKQAESSLLSQLGLLPAHYAQHTINNQFEKYRLNYLKAYKQLYFFTDSGVNL